MMAVLLVLLYLCIGAIVTFTLCRLYTIVEPYDKYNGFEYGYIAVGVFLDCCSTVRVCCVFCEIW